MGRVHVQSSRHPDQRKRSLVGLLVLTLGTLPLAVFACGPETVAQPIAFSHQIHVGGEGLECQDCHQTFETGPHSGLPELSICLDCHDEALTKSEEEAKLRALAETETPLIWGRLYQLPQDVHYSHQRHVKVARIACETCHGPIAESQVPPRAPLVAQDMDWCLECHVKEGATEDCVHCHK